jgi:hypothetical protein
MSVRRALRNLPGLKLHFYKAGKSGTSGLALRRAAYGISVASNAGTCSLAREQHLVAFPAHTTMTTGMPLGLRLGGLGPAKPIVGYRDPV